jgi:hypothetical protein
MDLGVGNYPVTLHNVRYTTLTRVQLSSVNAINSSNRLNPHSARRI